jgi:hypothetical protein
VIQKFNEKFKRNILLSVGVYIIYNRHGTINLQVFIINRNFGHSVIPLIQY